MKNKTVFIHIGTPKTGTTSIQKFFNLNNQQLFDEYGVFYPMGGRIMTPAICYVNGHCLLSEDDSKDQFLEKSINKFKDSNCSVMVISEEKLFYRCGIDLEKLEFLTQQCDVKVIIYFRNSFEYIAGIWQERIKNYGTELFINYLPHMKEEYRKDLENFYKIAEIVGKDNIIVKIFDKEELEKQSLIDGFLEVIGVHNSDELKQPNLENEGFSREKLEKFVFINRTLSPHLSSQFKDINPLTNIVENKGTKLIESFPDEMIKEVCDLFYPFECGIAKDFLGTEQLFTNKYPKVYGTKRSPYRGLSQSDANELNLAVNLQKLEVVNKILEEITSQKRAKQKKKFTNLIKTKLISPFKRSVVKIFHVSDTK